MNGPRVQRHALAITVLEQAAPAPKVAMAHPCIRQPLPFRPLARRWAMLAAVVVAGLGADRPAFGAAQQRDVDEVEPFEAVDPYTKGDPELLSRLGYVSFGPFPLFPGEFTDQVRESLGGIELLWVETAHFKIGSNLPTYRISQDRDERALIDRDLARLRKRMGRLKAPRRDLDPWLRLHLYAQRIEDIYEDFCQRFGLSADAFPKTAPYLGQPEKYVVMLLDKKSSMGRFFRRYANASAEFSYRFAPPGGGYVLGLSAEALQEIQFELDTAFYCSVASNLAHGFVESYRGNFHLAPTWWQFGLAHWYSRRIDPRFVPATGYGEDRLLPEGHSEWESRVLNLVRGKSFSPTERMFGWRKYEDLDVRDHMVAWSRVDFLLGLPDGDRRGFLDALCLPPPKGRPEAVAAEWRKRQEDALEKCFGLTPDQLDEAWSRHVRRAYR